MTDNRYALPIEQTLTKPVEVSFEFFPPKTEKMQTQLWECIRRLEPLSPSFVSVTYGAGGSTRERTHDTVVRLVRETNLPPAAHLTCVGHTKDEIAAIAKRYWDEGIRHIVALRGDPPDDENGKRAAYVPHPDGYAYAVDLVAGLKKIAPFEISVAAYPETHPGAPYPQFDLDNLKRKIDAGACRAITQYFFDVDVYRRFLDRCLGANIAVPIIPGILPVTNFNALVKMSAECGTRVPSWMAQLFAGLDDDPETRRLVAATVTAEQVRALAADGIDQFHFYTLNRADLTYAICHILGVRAKKES